MKTLENIKRDAEEDYELYVLLFQDFQAEKISTQAKTILKLCRVVDAMGEAIEGAIGGENWREAPLGEHIKKILEGE